MGQYRAEFEVGKIDRRGREKFRDIDRRPRLDELEAARDAAREAGLRRFDERSATALNSAL